MLSLLVILCLVTHAVAPPPQRAQHHANQEQQNNHGENQTPNPHPNEQAQKGQKPMYEVAYSKYLEEVVKILESDPKFTERLKGMPEADIKEGKIADHIDDLDAHVFDKLHKAKLEEIERLREQIQKQIEADGGAHNVKLPDHLDVNNWEKFGREDLRKLIVKTVEDMNQIDKERQANFKEYELKKKAEEDHRLAQMEEEERIRALREAEDAKKRHNDHEKLKHPGSRDQLEEVWEDSDHMEKDSFDPRTFFALHDLNGDGFWNADELEALFQLELEKMYNETNPDDDPRERMEEMYRMREHVTKQMDKNGDRMISIDEFLQDTEAQTPDKDPGWKDLGDQQVYTDEELQQFEKEYAKQQVPHVQSVQPQHVNQNVPPVQQEQRSNHVNDIPVRPQEIHASPQQVPVHHEPIVDLPKDPSYGI